MITKIVKSIKYIAVFSIVLMSIVACEKDFENVGIGLVDNNLFTTKNTTLNVIAYNQNVESSRIGTGNPHLLGVTNDANFGLIKASIVAQVGRGSISFTDNMSIDAVVLNIPYFTVEKELDSIIGNQAEKFDISVYENGTFLNNLDPLNPTQGKKYYSNETYTKKAQLYSGEFSPSKNDTIFIIERRFLDGNPSIVNDVDTLSTDNGTPSIKIPLDTTFFRNHFINQQNTGVFDSDDSFKNYFRGLIIEADGTDGSLMSLPMNNATMIFYYTNVVLKDETEATGDLNNDGDTNDTDVPVKTKQTATFPLNGLIAGTYNRDYTQAGIINSYFNAPDSINGEDKLFVQGAAGSIAVLDLLKGITPDQLDQIRNENWLINDASLSMYVENVNDSIPQRLYLYNFDENTQVLDAITEQNTWQFSGALEKDKDNKPIKYKFTITDYISEVLKSDDPMSLQKLAVKVLHRKNPNNQQQPPADYPVYPGPREARFSNDTNMRDYSWDAKGVILKGNNLSNSADSTQLKLEIFYTISDQ